MFWLPTAIKTLKYEQQYHIYAKVICKVASAIWVEAKNPQVIEGQGLWYKK